MDRGGEVAIAVALTVLVVAAMVPASVPASALAETPPEPTNHGDLPGRVDGPSPALAHGTPDPADAASSSASADSGPGNANRGPGSAGSGPATGNPSDSGRDSAPADGGSDAANVEPPSGNSSVVLRRQARAALADAPERGNGRRSAGLAERIDSSIEAHRSPNRTDDVATFTETTSVVASTQRQTPEVATLLVRADRRLAATAIADVRRVLDGLDARDVDVEESAAREHLDEAVERYERGVQQAERDQLPAASNRYRQAWSSADRALDDLQERVDPRLSLSTRRDPTRNGTYEYPVNGSVFAVRPTTIENVTVAGESALEEPDDPVAPGRPRQFAAFVNVTAPTRSIDVVATHGAADDGSERTVLRLDRDGLPDRYEVDVTGTDPLDPDSNATTTPTDESDDGTIDGDEDLDADGARNVLEYLYGSDPTVADTDGDGVADGPELELDLDPTLADTDDDGVGDGAEDADADGLGNARELSLGTRPDAPDTDGDGIDDGREVEELGTDPLVPDTDEDGLADADELRVGTDPLDPDTDDDGVLDGDETYTTRTTAAVANSSVELEVVGDGALAAGVDVSAETAEPFQTSFVANHSVGPTVNIDAETEISRANVTVEYDESRLAGNESEVGVFRYNRSLQAFVPLDGRSVDVANDTVTGATDQFSTFAVFSIPSWLGSVTAQTPGDGADSGDGGDGAVAPVDVVFALDSSGSMSTNDPNGLRKVGAKRFVGALIEGDRAAVVDFDSSATVRQSLTDDFDAVNGSIDAVDSFGGTDVGEGLHDALDELDANSADDRSKAVILLSDGISAFGDYDEVAQAHRAARDNVTVHTIGLGNADQQKLQSVATITGGESYFVDSADELPQVFSRVADDATGPQFTDDDEFSDGLEERGVPVSPFLAHRLDDAVDTDGFPGPDAVHTDPNATDTDGDGLADDRELGRLVNYTLGIPGTPYVVTRSYYTVVSDPTDENSDDTGLADAAELDRGSDPLRGEQFAPGAITPLASTHSNPDTPATVGDLENCCDATIPEADRESLVVQAKTLDAVGGDGPFAPDDDLEVTVETTVFAQHNDAAERLLEDSDAQVEVAFRPVGVPHTERVSGPETVTLQPGENRTVEHTFVVSPRLGGQLSFRGLQDVYTMQFSVENLDETPFHRSAVDDGGTYSERARLSTPGSPILMSTVELLDRTEIILGTGFAVATAPSRAVMLIETARGALELAMYELSGNTFSQVGPSEFSAEELATSAAVDGIGAFNSIYVEGQIEEESLDLNATVGGPITVRQN